MLGQVRDQQTDDDDAGFGSANTADAMHKVSPRIRFVQQRHIA
jgi:hypothetical protein